jgi:hypothetical protein
MVPNERYVRTEIPTMIVEVLDHSGNKVTVDTDAVNYLEDHPDGCRFWFFDGNHMSSLTPYEEVRDKWMQEEGEMLVLQRKIAYYVEKQYLS